MDKETYCLKLLKITFKSSDLTIFAEAIICQSDTWRADWRHFREKGGRERVIDWGRKKDRNKKDYLRIDPSENDDNVLWSLLW